MREHKNISIADQIFEQLEREILAGKYARGEVLSELSLSKQLGVSRTPVREAIRRLEQELDCHFAFVLGASGNVNNRSRISSEIITPNYELHYTTLAEKAQEAMVNFREVKIGNVKVINEDVSCTLKAGSGKLNIPISTASIGDVAFVAASYEMFDTNGKFVKDNSPFEMTFVSSCTNGSNSYIPTKPTFEYGGYEVESSVVAAGSAEQIADAMVGALNKLK
jgi:hypothetical protein